MEKLSKPFIRVTRSELQKRQHSKQCVVVSASVLQEPSIFNVSLKLCLILCSQMWEKRNFSLANISIPNGSFTLKIILSTGFTNFSNALRKILQLLELRMFGSSLFMWKKISSLSIQFIKSVLAMFFQGVIYMMYFCCLSIHYT